ncbi:Uncharacterised protein [Chromobacterium violaceum]|uniref:Uncharacterized protein n=1 Tax=Chromobacterium violaceum TaxID=536 RepID=A0A3S4LG06_CHRVL|nr:Uncharacterised protein [Chromobacterium violaceum]
MEAIIDCNEYGEDFALHVMPALRDLCRAQQAPATPRDVAMQALRRYSEGRCSRPLLESVESLQAKVLTPAQLNALADIQDAIQVLAQVERAINQQILLHGLKLRPLALHQPGMMIEAIENMLPEARVAEAKLLRGGLPLRAEQPQAVPAARVERAA